MPNNTNPSIAVIIPTYNRANTIVQCINSVLSQSYPINEIIIVDDNSSDDTVQRLNIFKDEIVILHTISRSGPQTARNIGIKSAKSNSSISFTDLFEILTSWSAKKGGVLLLLPG